MPRDIDQKKTRKALRKLRRAKTRAEAEGGPGLTDWEQEFVEGVEQRLETYGSAFNDPDKGALDEALSMRQTEIVKQIDKKARGKGLKRSSFKPKSPERRANMRDIHDDAPCEERAPPPASRPRLVEPSAPPANTAGRPAVKSPALRVIDGGRS